MCFLNINQLNRNALAFSLFGGIFAASTVLASGCAAGKEDQKRPNIIIVLADDQGWGDMAYNGHPVLQTPNFDRMASEGLQFDRFYAAAPVCSPTRGSIMTGRHPNRFGCFSWGYTLRPQELTVAEALQNAGYVTGHFGKWHLGSVVQGSPVNPGNSGFDEWVSSPNFFENDPIFSHQGIARQEHGESSMVTMDAALAFIEKSKGGKQPFFAYVCFGSPHQPHIASEEDKQLYPDQPGRLKNFLGEISGMDRALGKLREQLKIWDIEKNTILWYVSDNGGLPRVGSTGGRGYKGQIYEGGLRVPSIIQWPEKITAHRVANMPCNTYDIFPTLLEVAGVNEKPPHPIDGISLLPVINNQMSERLRPIGFWRYTSAGKKSSSSELMTALLELQKNQTEKMDSSFLDMEAGIISQHYNTDTLPGHAAWLNWPYKLHRIYDDNEPVKFELYNLENDPMEQQNLAGTDSVRVTAMSGQLTVWMKSVINSLNGEDYQ